MPNGLESGRINYGKASSINPLSVLTACILVLILNIGLGSSFAVGDKFSFKSITGSAVLDSKSFAEPNVEPKFHVEKIQNSNADVKEQLKSFIKEAQSRGYKSGDDGGGEETITAGKYTVYPVIPLFNEMTPEEKQLYLDAARYAFNWYFSEGSDMLKRLLGNYNLEFVSGNEQIYQTSIHNIFDAVYEEYSGGNFLVPGIYHTFPENSEQYAFMQTFGADPDTIPVLIAYLMSDGVNVFSGGFINRVHGFFVITITQNGCGGVWTFAHEMGHSMGLDHAVNQNNLMSDNPLCGTAFTKFQAGDFVAHLKTPELMFSDIGKYAQLGPDGACWNNVLDDEEECEKNYIAIDQQTCVDITTDPPNARDPKPSKVGRCEKDPQKPDACKCIKITGGSRDPWDVGKPGCGNGHQDPGEQCDDGNNETCDGCSPNCKNEFCGDNLFCPQMGEQCGEPGAAPCTNPLPTCQDCECTKSCQRDDQCPQGYLCIDGWCKPEGEADCMEDDDCGARCADDETAVCHQHKCYCTKCGNDKVEPREQCDPPGSDCNWGLPCPRGICSGSCACVAQKCPPPPPTF